MNDINELELCLKAAREWYERVSLLARQTGGGFEGCWAADQEVLRLERLLAAAKGEEYAEKLAFPVLWNAGAPLPHVMVNDNRALLTFLVREHAPNWDGTFVKIKSPVDEGPEPLALVEFERCMSAKLGSPNDEVFQGHPLSGKGLDGYTAQEVMNSHWLKDIEKINSDHHMYDPEFWRDLHHYVFWFHDTTFECIARSIKVETHRISMREMLDMMVDRLVA